MIWYIDDFNQHQITITDTIREWTIPKFRIYMEVEEPILYLYWNDREQGDGGDERLLEIDYRDVVDGYGGYVDNPASATALMATIETMIVSGFGSGTTNLLTNKADLLSHDGVSDTILPGGPNEYIPVRDNATQTGFNYISQSQIVQNGGGLTAVAVASPLTGDGTGGSPITLPSILIAKTAGLGTVTGTAAETIVYSQAIAANTIGNNDAIEVVAMARRTTGAGTLTMNVYLNDTNNLTTPQLIGQVATAGTQTLLSRSVQKWLDTNNSTVGTPTTGIASVFGAAPYTTTIDNTATMYVIFTLTQGTAGDTSTLYYGLVNHWRV